jgi:hypothetical protein
MKGTYGYTNRLHVYRYFVNRFKQLSEIAEFLPVVLVELIVRMYGGILMTLVER